jgi:hypothetical protein
MWKPLKLAPWLIAAGVAWSFGFTYNVVRGGELSWLRMMYEAKIANAAQVKASKRLLITGGSGAHYTINAKVLEQGLGIPVLNLGLDGPIGLNVILPSILPAVRPGDVVLLVPEYLLLLGDNNPPNRPDDGFGDRSGSFGTAIGRPGLGGLPPKQLAQDLWTLGIPSLRSLTKSALDLLEKGQLTGYYSDPVDDRGDPTVTKVRTGKWWKLRIDQPISPTAFQRIARFRQEVEARGATLIISLPWIYGSSDRQTVTNVQKTAQALATIAPLIYEQDTFNIKKDSHLFADTHYHLLPEARKIRAEELVEQLKPLLNAQDKASHNEQ